MYRIAKVLLLYIPFHCNIFLFVSFMSQYIVFIVYYFTQFFISNTFIYSFRLKFGENIADAKQHFQAENEKDFPKWPKYGYFMLAFG